MGIEISFIIPCFNEGLHIKSCLNSIEQQQYPRSKFEIIVVDNGSTDNSPSIAREIADHVALLPGKNVGAVRNHGASLARGELLIFIDADCLVDDQWLTRALALTLNEPESVFGGGCLLPANPHWLEKNWLLEGRQGNTLPTALIGCSIAVNKNSFAEIGGFDESLESGEDTDFSLRALSKGYKVKITRDLNVTHLGNAKTVKAFMRRQMWHARSYATFNANQFKDPIFITTVLFILCLPGLLVKPSLFGIVLIACPAVLSLKRIARARPKLSSINPPAIYALDLLYLTGRAAGLINTLFKRFSG